MSKESQMKPKPYDMCQCSHIARVHGRDWIGDDACRGCDCPDFEYKEPEAA